MNKYQLMNKFKKKKGIDLLNPPVKFMKKLKLRPIHYQVRNWGTCNQQAEPYSL